jgi:CHAT domain-containing protein
VVRRFGGDSVLLLQGDASEKRLKETDLSRHGVIHFAAHAVVDERHPDRSAILLAPGSHEEDGWLQVGEIAALDLDGQLIGLSACQTADGALLRGEGVLNLARAFFQAGARAVVASLWPLRDEEAAWLFDTFYARVVRGHTAAEALRDTQREAIRRGFPAAAWASLVLIGDGSTRPVPGGIGSGRTVERSLWMAGIVIALTIALLVVYTRRRS